MPNSADVVVIGGGVVGLCVAQAVAQRGGRATLVERDDFGKGCSFANAGLIVPSFSLPLASPSTIRHLPQLLLGEGRVVAWKPRLDLRQLGWIVSFLRACQRARMLETGSILSQLGQRSQEIFLRWAEQDGLRGLKQDGWLHLYETESGLEEAVEQAELLRGLGLPAESLGPRQVSSLEPGLAGSFQGGVFFPREGHIDPYALIEWLLERARALDVELLAGEEVKSMATRAGRVDRLELADGSLRAESFVLAAGAWSRDLMAPALGWVPLEPGKGCSLTFASPPSPPRRPLMFGEQHIVATPFADRFRVTTGMDLVGFDGKLPESAVRRLRSAAIARIPELAGQSGEAWFGYRPMTPDGLPLVGQTRRLENLWLATGHGQLGITLGPVTGEIVADMLLGKAPPAAASGLSPARFRL